MFQKHGVNRATTTGVLENVRMVIETAMVDGLVGSGQVLRSLAQKRGFLVQLHPRDRMRLLAVVSASAKNACPQSLQLQCAPSLVLWLPCQATVL